VETRKRIYIGLLAGSLFFTVLMVTMVWYLFTNRDLIFNQILLIVIALITGIIFIILATGITSLIIMIIRSKTIPSLENTARIANELLFPITLIVGKLLGVNKQKILRSYIEVNNYLVTSKKLILPGTKIMLLLPHCLQNSECPFKITADINNCKQCGKCKIGELRDLAQKYNITIKVATGGTMARKYVRENRPQAIVAVACERDLFSGIQDTGALPVIGVLNRRPNGPCYNTDVDLEAVEAALSLISKGG
jgi:hypothetical protein